MKDFDTSAASYDQQQATGPSIGEVSRCEYPRSIRQMSTHSIGARGNHACIVRCVRHVVAAPTNSRNCVDRGVDRSICIMNQ